MRDRRSLVPRDSCTENSAFSDLGNGHGKMNKTLGGYINIWILFEKFKHSISYSSALVYTTFLVFLSGANMKRFSPLETLEHATYNWPCEKHSVSKLTPATLRDWPCALLIVIQKANLIGNCRRLNWNGKLVGMTGIRGMNTSDPDEKKKVRKIRNSYWMWISKYTPATSSQNSSSNNVSIQTCYAKPCAIA